MSLKCRGEDKARDERINRGGKVQEGGKGAEKTEKVIKTGDRGKDKNRASRMEKHCNKGEGKVAETQEEPEGRHRSREAESREEQWMEKSDG